MDLLFKQITDFQLQHSCLTQGKKVGTSLKFVLVNKKESNSPGWSDLFIFLISCKGNN